MRRVGWQVWMLAGCLAMVACNESPSSRSIEELIFDHSRGGTNLIRQTISGFVSCGTCQRATSSMAVQVWAPDITALTPLVDQTFPFLGAYGVTVKVPHSELLEIHVTIITAGGILQATKSITAVPDPELSEAALTVDFEFQ